MDRFEEILKEKVDQFEVPYNDAHWAEMEGKLNKIKATKIKNTILGVAAGVVTLGVASYFIFFSPNTTDNTINNSGNEIISENTSEIVINPENITENNTNAVEESNNEKVVKEKLVEENPTNQLEENNDSKEINLIKVNPSQEDINDVITEVEEEKNIVSNSENNKITADFIVYNNKVCAGEEVSFEAIETAAQVSYLWNFGDGKTSGKSNPTHIYEESMDYTITLTIIDKQTGKEYTKIQHDAVQILPEPDTYFTYSEESKKHDDNKLMYPYTMFYVKNANKESTYKWNFGNSKTASSAEPKTVYHKADNYIVTLIAENEYGCVKTIQKRVNIKQGVNLFAPNAFTPNQDGTNEKFIPKALIEWDIPFEMVITSKSGRTVYKTSDKNEPWNGKLNNVGQLLDEGIYIWQVVITDAYGLKHSYQGNIQLIK